MNHRYRTSIVTMRKEQQHYVPRFLLKNFTRGKKPLIWAYDKATDRVFQTNIENVAAEKGFYDLELHDAVLTMEPGLAHLEAKTSGIIKQLLREKALGKLDIHSRSIVAMFLAVQFLRTKEHGLRVEHLGKLLQEGLRNRGAREENLRELMKPLQGVKQSKRIRLKTLLKADRIAPYFLNKAWALLETKSAAPFYISDNPITLHNEMDHGPYGNIGLAVPGIEIYLPISTSLTIALFCPSVVELFRQAQRNMDFPRRTAPQAMDAATDRAKKVRAFCNGLAEGTPIEVSEDNVTRLNSLQVTYSSRFVYCESDSFELVRRMINDDPSYREGLRPTVG